MPLELITLLDDSVVEHTLATGVWEVGEVSFVPAGDGYRVSRGDVETVLAMNDALRIRCGLGWVVATVVEPPRRHLPGPAADRRALGFIAASLVAHLALLAAALPIPPPQPTGRPRRGVVANHVSAPRAERAREVTPALDRVDERALAPRPDVATATTQAPAPEHAPVIGPAPRPTPDGARDVAAAHHFDPCADGDCGLIATGGYDTSATGAHAGAEYELRPHRALDTSVVTCNPDTGCTTVSGDDQGELRGELARHVSDLDACFAGGAGASIAVDIHVDGRGAPTVAAHGEDTVATCIASVVGKLAFPAIERDVTLAFARG